MYHGSVLQKMRVHLAGQPNPAELGSRPFASGVCLVDRYEDCPVRGIYVRAVSMDNGTTKYRNQGDLEEVLGKIPSKHRRYADAVRAFVNDEDEDDFDVAMDSDSDEDGEEEAGEEAGEDSAGAEPADGAEAEDVVEEEEAGEEEDDDDEPADDADDDD